MSGIAIEYHEGDTTLEGFLAMPASTTGPVPLVLVAHAWAGRDQFACEQAERLSQLGYAGFALDVFGKGKLGTSMAENEALMTPFVQDRQLLQRRLLAGLETASAQSGIDRQRIAAIGFCFGGLCALDLARAGVEKTGPGLRGVVSFHGLFMPAEGVESGTIKASVLALHGHDDPMVPPEQVLALEKEMTAAGADWQIQTFGHTSHAFTNPDANMPENGMQFQQRSARRAWVSMENFLGEVLS